MGKYKNLGGAVISPFYADGQAEIPAGATVDLPDQQADGSPLYWSPEHFERLDGENPIHELEAPVEDPNAGPQAPAPDPTPVPDPAPRRARPEHISTVKPDAEKE